MNGQRYSVERHRLCVWLEDQKARLATVPAEERANRESELEAEFRNRLDRLYGEARGALDPSPDSHN